MVAIPGSYVLISWILYGNSDLGADYTLGIRLPEGFAGGDGLFTAIFRASTVLATRRGGLSRDWRSSEQGCTRIRIRSGRGLCRWSRNLARNLAAAKGISPGSCVLSRYRPLTMSCDKNKETLTCPLGSTSPEHNESARCSERQGSSSW